MNSRKYKAVILDMGGVLIPGPADLHSKKGKKSEDLGKKAESLQKIFKTLFSEDFSNHWHDLECGITSIQEFYPYFKTFYYSHHGEEYLGAIEIFSNHTIPGRPESTVKPIWFPVLKKIREEGLKVAVLTNNFWIDSTRSEKTTPLDEKHYDIIFESCKLGMRKPNRDIYEHVLSELKIQPEEAIFIDDLIQNIEGANQVGLTTIHCTDIDKTISSLEDILEISLKNDNFEKEQLLEASKITTCPAN
uniref:Uncharacterized protein n=1 Tax=Acrobeloides nanus TaxID=290746 RepID=A0A914EQQ8_9BILA